MGREIVKDDLRPFFRRTHWLIPAYGVVMLILSPVIVPLFVAMANMGDVRDAYREILGAIKYRPWVTDDGRASRQQPTAAPNAMLRGWDDDLL